MSGRRSVTLSPSEIALEVNDLEVSFVDSDGSLEVLDKISFLLSAMLSCA